MKFVVRALFLSAAACAVHAGLLSGGHHGQDSYVSSALSAPSASYGTPSTVYGPPALNDASLGDLGHVSGGLEGGVISDDHALDHGHGLGGSGILGGSGLDAGYSDAGIPSGVPLGDDGLGSGLAGPLPAALSAGQYGAGAALGGAALQSPRVIGTTVSVGRPNVQASQYELQSVVQNVVRRVPIIVTRHVKVAVPQPVPVPVPQEVKVPVPQPYPVHVDVVKHVPYPVYKTEHVEVERPVPYEVVKKVPVEVIRKVPVPVEKPYEVIKKVHVPIEKHVEVPVPVWKPYPIHIIKHVTHYKKKHCCW
ncbi:uncharacterized protein LOC131854590 [Achroia grisella]|uniref:uncharacterized protein LOC131854590 n=1 Tax=Achroia grisella TaxID=688607 RepID=UPI0027D2CDB7|nr:uncharacterized protein LOC131854590 [Achroia grisella]